MGPDIQEKKTPFYQTITGRRISMAKLTDTEFAFLQKIAKKYTSKQDWTRFAAWWNAEFNASNLSASSFAYRICQDLEARLGINQGKVSAPDYRDFLAELIDAQFGSRQEFCRTTEVDPGQLSRVLGSRSADLSMKVLQKVLEVLHAHVVIQTEEESRTQTSVERAAEAITVALFLRGEQRGPHPVIAPPNCPVSSRAEDVENCETMVSAWKHSFPNVANLPQVVARTQAVAKSQMPLMILPDAA